MVSCNKDAESLEKKKTKQKQNQHFTLNQRQCNVFKQTCDLSFADTMLCAHLFYRHVR